MYLKAYPCPGKLPKVFIVISFIFHIACIIHLSIAVILFQFFIFFLSTKKVGAAISSLVLKKQTDAPAQHYPHWPWQRLVPGKAMRKKINAPQKQVYKHVGCERLFEMSPLAGNMP
jgi:hypothetical protein